MTQRDRPNEGARLMFGHSSYDRARGTAESLLDEMLGVPSSKF